MHPHAPVIKTGRDLPRGLTHPAIHPPHTFSCKNSFRSCCAAIVFITDIRLFFLDTFYIQAFPEATRIVHWVKPNWSLVPGKKKFKKRFYFHRELETPFVRVRAGPGAMALTWPFRGGSLQPPLSAPLAPVLSRVARGGGSLGSHVSSHGVYKRPNWSLPGMPRSLCITSRGLPELGRHGA